MRERYIPAIVMLIAGAITSILNIVNKIDPFQGLVRLLVILILFFIIGMIIKAIIVKFVMNGFKKSELSEDEDEDSTEEKTPVVKIPEGKKQTTGQQKKN